MWWRYYKYIIHYTLYILTLEVVELSVGKQRRHKEDRREGKRREGRRRKEEMRKEDEEEVNSEQIEDEDEGLIYLTRKQPHSERQGKCMEGLSSSHKLDRRMKALPKIKSTCYQERSSRLFSH